MNTQQYIEYLVQQQLNNEQSPLNTINKYANGLNAVNKFGNNMQTAGNYLQGFDNNVLNKLGSGLSKAGNFVNDGVSAIKNAPKNVFTGFAKPTNPAIEGAIADTLGTSALNTGLNTGVNAGLGTIGNAVADTAGSSLAGVGSTIGTEGATTAGASTAVGVAAPLVALGVMALQGNNRNRSKQSAQNLMSQTNQMVNDNTTQDFANAMVQQAQNNINKGVMTGGASPIEPDVVGLDNEMSQLGYTPQQKMSAMNGLNGGDKVIASLVDKYNITKPQTEAPVEAPVNNVQTGGVEETKRGLLDKFMSGIGDFAQGYQENRNNGFKPENFGQDRFAEQTTTYTPNQQLVDYQNNLRNQGMDENIVNAVALGKNSGNKDIDEWIKANPEALKPVANTKTTYTGKEKSKMARFGEGMGTIARALQNPNLQGIVAGGLGTALTGNPLYGLGLGYKFANQRAMSDAYRNVLKQYGVNVPDMGTFGNITGQDMRNIGNLAETHAWHQYLNQRNADELARKIAKDEVDKKYKENKMLVDKQNADSRTTSAQARMIRANQPKTTGGKGGGKGGSGTTKPDNTKPENMPGYGRRLSQYEEILMDPKAPQELKNRARRAFMKDYKGTDPDKKLGL